ncbi:MAG: ABC transporter ATP-binding protein [Candidatus Pacebacteria bacterium]|jgi:ATP-binding cassette, subfamily B, heavy metal transporter|nr:ABC transporter ATP-binding protein [Candidatus Paceibacterota bacterium]MBT3511841.1 ABC transporter ATP-binding protein [Candidatus Paceibacterota bacterium]MBT4005057.1 ABC transporter ATP-binding protein [Candidatus Paceibacterota bacterium]MBT4359298.1 ABC transporter ATP-binding protein [Candidatus Paceibacterota bacterium]MBT4680867.1 ABC transporter ATP-binding protein [Candidatus Paceibacterota bacterium]
MSVFKRLYHFIWQRKWPFILGSIPMVISMILNNLAPFFVKWLTIAVQDGLMDHAFRLVLIFGLILFISNLLENIGYYITDKNMVGASNDISKEVLTHIHNLDFAYHTNKSSGKLISLMKRGDDAFFAYYDIINRKFLNLAISFAVMFFAFARLRLEYLLFVFLLIAITVLVAYFLIKINIKRRQEFNDADDNVSSARVDNLVNFDTVKYFANEKFEQSRFSKLLAIWNQRLQAYFFTFRYFDGIVGNLINFALVGIMFLAVRDLRNQQIVLADFLLVTTFSMTLLPKMMQLLFSLRELAKKNTDISTYLDLLDEKITVPDPIQPRKILDLKGEISFNKVDFAYENKQLVLKDFSLQIESGEAIALVGFSGAGKTTVAKLIMRMYDPTSGQILIDGIAINKLLKDELRKIVGVVPQDPLLFNNTVYFNIAYANQKASKEEVLAAAKAAQVDTFIKDLPNGYKTIVGERGIKLSGGQRQRLAIARMLLEKPKIIIMDEATSSLDSASEQIIQQAFWDLVRDQRDPRTSIIIAHRLSTIMQADRIVVMNEGQIAEIGTHEELIQKDGGIYQQLWSLQRNGFIGDGESDL